MGAPGHHDQYERPVNLDDGTTALTASGTPSHAAGPDDVSVEIGACFLPISTGLRGLSPAEMQVLAWLRANRPDIVAAEQTFRVDRRAVAGAIAWEMLENVAKSARVWVGVGKMHTIYYDKNHVPATLMALLYNFYVARDPGKGTLAQEVEDCGYLPKQSYETRLKILATPRGGIQYVAASMLAFAEIAFRYTSQDLRGRPDILTNAYQSKTLTSWEEAVAKKAPGSFFTGGNTMDLWVSSHLAFLEDGVGKPDLLEGSPFVPAVTAPGVAPATGPKTVVMSPGSSLSSVAQAEYGSPDLWPLLYDLNKAKIGQNPNLVRRGLRLSVAPLASYTPEQIAQAKLRAPSWKRFQ
jgi:hypothetical protein